MPSKRQDKETLPSGNRYKTYEEIRASRRELRTSWITDATEKEKETALRVALNKAGGGKKYSWLQNGPTTVAETLGQKRAIELGIRTGKLAKELKIGEYRDKDGPQKLVVRWDELRGAGINMSKEEFEKLLRDMGTLEEEIQAAIGSDASSVAQASTSTSSDKKAQLYPSVEKPLSNTPDITPAPTAPIVPAKKRGIKRPATEDGDEATSHSAKRRKGGDKTSDTPAPTPPIIPANGRGKKRPATEDGDEATSNPAKKRKGGNKTSDTPTSTIPIIPLPAKKRGGKRPATEEGDEATSHPAKRRKGENKAPSRPARSLVTPPKSRSPEAARGPCPSDAVAQVEEAPLFGPPSPTISELDALLVEKEQRGDNSNSTNSNDDTAPTFAPPSPTISELNALLVEEERGKDSDEAPLFAPPSPTIPELEALLVEEEEEEEEQQDGDGNNSKTSLFAPASPTISEFDALLAEEEEQEGGD